MKLSRYLLLLILLAFIPPGCAPPVTYVVDIAYTPELKSKVPAKPEQIQIAVIPFDDGRADKRIIGARRRILGRIDKFDARPSPVSDAVTRAIISGLKIRGYQTELLQRGIDAEGIMQSPPQIVISGKIEELWADARSKPGYTDIKTSVRLRVKVFNVDEKSSYTVNVQSQSEPRVLFFNPSVMQNTINDTITDAINRLIAQQWKTQ